MRKLRRADIEGMKLTYGENWEQEQEKKEELINHFRPKTSWEKLVAEQAADDAMYAFMLRLDELHDKAFAEWSESLSKGNTKRTQAIEKKMDFIRELRDDLLYMSIEDALEGKGYVKEK